ncbi:MAG: hypothetical protein KGL39_42320 [Patescibacteria group bacterium]|nr:hypothetical protein [Patescibacteria group bacterium]
MTDPATRNRMIKKTLELAFGRGKVRVRGSRGTSYGYVTVNIDWTPLDHDKAREMRGLCKQLLRAAGIDLGHAYADDTCQWETDRCTIEFNRARYHRTMRHSDGSMSVMADRWKAEWSRVEA